MEKLDLYRCETCGNVVEVLVNGGGELVCCGNPMKKLFAQSQEEAVQEKHVPIFVKQEENGGEIRVGEILHPMQENHYIMFIQAISPDKNNVYLKFCHPYSEPKLYLQNIDDFNYAREFCNIHGLWEGNND